MTLAALAAGAAVSVAPASGSPAGGAHARTPVVTVSDDLYTPVKVKIHKDGKVKWRWADTNINTHNVALTGEHPDGVKRSKFRSESGAINLSFSRKFKVPGRYAFVCTYHPTLMKMAVQVKRH